jgi:predicted DNA-binding protein (UPF0251 family)
MTFIVSRMTSEFALLTAEKISPPQFQTSICHSVWFILIHDQRERIPRVRLLTMATDPEKSRILNAADWISKGDASRARGVSRQAIWDLVHRGRLTTCVVAGRTYVSRSEVLNFKRRPRGPAFPGGPPACRASP